MKRIALAALLLLSATAARGAIHSDSNVSADCSFTASVFAPLVDKRIEATEWLGYSVTFVDGFSLQSFSGRSTAGIAPQANYSLCDPLICSDCLASRINALEHGR